MRLNSTGRVKIPLHLVSIRLIDDPSGGPARFTAELSGLKSLNVPATGRIIVEPYVKQSSMRFDYGTIEMIRIPADTALTEIDRGAPVQFRVKVVDSLERPGRLLASAERIRPRDEDEDIDRRSILPLREADLGQAVWKIEVGREESPYLIINKRIPDLLHRIYEDPVLQGAIYATAAREVIRVLLKDDPDESDEWVVDWKAFAEDLIGESIPDDVDDDLANSIIDRAVDAFSERQGWVTRAQPIETRGFDDE